MPDEQRQNPRSIDERLDAIAMNLELQIAETEALRRHQAELAEQAQIEREQVRIERESDRQKMAEQARIDSEKWRAASAAFEDVRDSIRLLVQSTDQLLRTALSHQDRIERLER